MSRRLDDELTWTELCERTIQKSQIKKNELSMFRKWFMERECLGRHFDNFMIVRCFNIWKQLKNKLDHFIVICGREGLGKSTLSFQIAAWVCPNFRLEHICYDAASFLHLLREKAENLDPHNVKQDALVMDEGTELLSREAQNITNKILMKSFFIQRALKFLVIINIPNFHMLDTVVRFHRVKTLIEVIDRGKYKCITGKGITDVAKWGQQTKQVSSITIPYSCFWKGYFGKQFPKTLDRIKYEEHKIVGIKEALAKMSDDLSEKKMIGLSKVAKQLDLSNETLIRMVKNKKIKGKQIGSRWFITKDSYDRLLLV